jgi:hypothetical protein
LQLGKLRRESLNIIEAAQVQLKRAFMDTTDHGYGQPAKRRCDKV